jgi:hypothetical protein
MKHERLDCPYDFTSRCTMGRCDCKPKQETLEEGAKWRHEIMYSEEEVLKLLIYCKNKFGGSGLEDYTHDDEVKEWFEQFKNK